MDWVIIETEHFARINLSQVHSLNNRHALYELSTNDQTIPKFYLFQCLFLKMIQ